MANFKKGEKVLITNSYTKGKVVTVDKRYSNITGYYELIYTIRSKDCSYMYYYCSENSLVSLDDNELLAILYGVEED